MNDQNQPDLDKKPVEMARANASITAPMVLTLCSLAALILSQMIRADISREFWITPFIILPIGLITFFLGIWSVDRGRFPRWVERVMNACSSWLGIRPEQFICLVYSIVFGILTCTAAGFQYLMRSPSAAIICWLLGIGLALFGGWVKPSTRVRVSREVWISAVVIFAVSFTIRAINTATIPIVLSGDEASSGLFSLKFIRGEVNNLFITGWFSFPVLHNFLQSLSIRIFGQTTQALRLLAALGGALTVVLVYLVGKKMFGTLAGWAGAIFLTGMHFHNHFSRIGLNNIWDGFFFVLVLGSAWVGWKRNSRFAWLIAGVGLGLAQYFYATGRMLFAILPLWILVAGLFDHKRLKQAIPNVVLLVWVSVAVMLPLGWFYATHVNEFLAPMNRVSIMGDWLNSTAAEMKSPKVLVLLNQLKLGFFGYFEQPLRAWYMPGVPMLRAVPGVIFLIGLAFTIIRPRDERNQLMWVWLLAIAAAVGLSESAPAAQRYTAAAPALALMVGFGLFQLLTLLNKWLPRWTKVFSIVLIAASLIMAVDDLRFYYFVYTPNSDFSGFNGLVAQRLADKLKNETPGTQLYFDGYPGMRHDSISSLPYLAPQITYISLDAPWADSKLPAVSGNIAYFAFLPDHESDMINMEREYPGGTWTEEKYRNNDTLYWLYTWHPN
jgi:4-amino-4-deoxy-L-arabinose transferase-like glycosyltransferase